MEKNKQINRNRQQLSEQDIQKGQDFTTFLKAYQLRKLPFYKKTGFYLSTVLLVATLTALVYWLKPTDSVQASPSSAYISPPFGQLTIINRLVI
jgi:hypothetical protein